MAPAENISRILDTSKCESGPFLIFFLRLWLILVVFVPLLPQPYQVLVDAAYDDLAPSHVFLLLFSFGLKNFLLEQRQLSLFFFDQILGFLVLLNHFTSLFLFCLNLRHFAGFLISIYDYLILKLL